MFNRPEQAEEMEDMESIKLDVSDLISWRGVAEHRMTSIEKQRQEDVKEVARLKADVAHVDRRVSAVDIKVSRIEGGIDFLKWSIPISISVAMAIGSFIGWVVTQ